MLTNPTTSKMSFATNFGIIILVTLILSALHIHNGFPLVLTDSIGYLQRATSFVESSHWSNTYTFFIFANIKLFGTIQIVVILKNLFIALMLYIFLSYAFKDLKNYIYLAIAICLMSTTLPWISTLLMSDIFTPLTLLGIILILNKKMNKLEYGVLFFILLFGFSAHQSHLLIIPVFTLGAVVLQWIFRRVENRKSLFKNVCLILVLFIASNLFERNILNSNNPKKKTIAEAELGEEDKSDISSGFYFVAVRVAESGYLEKMLDSFCDENKENYLCNPSDNYTVSRVRNTPIKQRNSDNELYVKYSTDNKEFVMNSIKRPLLYYALSTLIAKRGFSLFRQTGIRGYVQFRKTQITRFTKLLIKVGRGDVHAFTKSKQIKRAYPLFAKNEFKDISHFWLFILFPIAMIFYVLFMIKVKLESNTKIFYLLCLLILAHLSNTLICGTFSNFENVRYSSRTLWLINLGILLLIFHLIENRNSIKAIFKS